MKKWLAQHQEGQQTNEFLFYSPGPVHVTNVVVCNAGGGGGGGGTGGGGGGGGFRKRRGLEYLSQGKILLQTI